MQVAPQTPHRMQDVKRITPFRVTGGMEVDAAMLAADIVAICVPASAKDLHPECKEWKSVWGMCHEKLPAVIFAEIPCARC